MFALIISLMAAMATSDGLSFTMRDCGPANKFIRYNSASVSPYPLVYPGSVKVGMDIDILQDMPADNVGIRIIMDKTYPDKLNIPCINGWGTCTYNFCHDVIASFSQLFSQFGTNKCPLVAKKYVNNDAIMDLPDFDPLFRKIFEGDFEGNATYYNTLTNQIYGCVHMQMTIVLKS